MLPRPAARPPAQTLTCPTTADRNHKHTGKSDLTGARRIPPLIEANNLILTSLIVKLEEQSNNKRSGRKFYTWNTFTVSTSHTALSERAGRRPAETCHRPQATPRSAGPNCCQSGTERLAHLLERERCTFASHLALFYRRLGGRRLCGQFETLARIYARLGYRGCPSPSRHRKGPGPPEPMQV